MNSFPDSFDALLSPISSDTFFEEYWQKKPLFVAREDRSYYDGLPSVDEFDSLITQNSANDEFYFTVLGDSEVDDPHDPDGTIDYQSVVE